MDNQPFRKVTAQVKLVIWDLDETFWKGTLSEEGITLISANIEMVNELVDCGINRDEIVNKPDDNGNLVRYDDVGFFISPRDMQLKHGRPLRNFIGHT